MRNEPNIVITGTPGVGKTSHCEGLADATGLRHLSINDIIKQNGCHEGWDEDLKCLVVDEDKLLDALEADMKKGGNIVDWHACDIFPEAWIDLVVVIRCDSTRLYDRLAARGYQGKKLEENMDAEIMQILLEEAREAYDEGIIIELHSNTIDDVEQNVGRIATWIENWKSDRKTEDT